MKKFLGNIERALGVWYPDPDDKPDDTNPAVTAAFRMYIEKRLGSAYSCASREDRVLGEPDLIALRNKDEKRFDIVTCYRSQMFIGEDGEAYLPWTTEETYAKLLDWEKKEGYPVYVLIGLHGYADVPKFVFAVPLKEAAIDLKKSVLSRFEKKKGDTLL